MGDGRLVVGKGGDGEGVAGAWVRADSRMVILGGDVGGGEEGGCVQKRPRNPLDSRVVHGVTGHLSICMWNLQVFLDDAPGQVD